MTATIFLPIFWKFPNLAQRADPLLGLPGRTIRLPHRTRSGVSRPREGERIWLFLYAPASFLYRIAVMLAIAIFIASQYLRRRRRHRHLGPADGRGAADRQGAVAGDRGPAVATQSFARGADDDWRLSRPARSCCLSFPHHFTRPPKVWCGFRKPPMCAPERTASCAACWWSRAVLSKSARHWSRAKTPTLNADARQLAGRVAELEAKLAAERFNDRVRAEIDDHRTRPSTSRVGDARHGAPTRLIARSRGEGAFAVLKPQDLPGRFMREGQLIGYVLPAGSRIVRATIGQDDIDLVRTKLRGVTVKLAERLDETAAGAHHSRSSGRPRRPAEQGVRRGRRRCASGRSTRPAGDQVPAACVFRWISSCRPKRDVGGVRQPRLRAL